MEPEPAPDDVPPPSLRTRLGQAVLWIVSFALCGGIMWSTASFQCMCGHTAMDAGLGWSIFGAFTLGGLFVGSRLQPAAYATSSRGVLAAVALMFVGTVAAHLLAGKDLGDAHKNMFKPADPSVAGQVRF